MGQRLRMPIWARPITRWLRTVALSPWWVLQLLSSAKSFVDNPVIGSPALNRAGLHRWRVRLACAMTQRRRARLARLITAEERAAFERDGFVMLSDLLPAPAFEQLRARLLAQAASAREMLQGDTVTQRISVDRALLQEVPELGLLLDHPSWSGLTRYVAGFGRAPWVYLQSILSHVNEAEPDPQTALHADTFHPTMKAWFFLTDVAEDEGPFCYVPGSHRLSAERLDWEYRLSQTAHAHPDRLTARGSFRIQASELAALGLPPPKAFAVKANTLVVADTFGFHARGPSARASVRIEVWGYDRRNPYFPQLTDGLLAAVGLVSERAAVYWGWLDQLERWKLARNPWRPAGVKPIGSPPGEVPMAVPPAAP
jgi:hypothetical protein